MRRFQTHGRHDAGIERSFPRLDAYAPAIAGLQAGESVLGARRNQIVADGCLVAQEFVVDHDTYGVAADVFGTAVAFSVAIEACQRVGATGLQGAAQNVLDHLEQAYMMTYFPKGVVIR